MRQHYYDQFGLKELRQAERRLFRQRLRQKITIALQWVGAAIVFGLIGGMLAYRG